MHNPTQSTIEHAALVDRLLSGNAEAKYQGKQVVLIGDQMAILPDDDQEAATLVEELEQQYPDQVPHLVSVPRPETTDTLSPCFVELSYRIIWPIIRSDLNYTIDTNYRYERTCWI